MITIITLISFVIFITLPGYSILRLLKSNNELSLIENVSYSTVLGFYLNLFIYTLLNTVGIKITRMPLLIFYLLLVTNSFVIKNFKLKRPRIKISRKNFKFILVLIFAILLRLPTLIAYKYPFTGDMSKHVFFSKQIIETGKLEQYSHPQYVLLEHVSLSLIPIITGINIISRSPFVIIYIINILIGLPIFLIAKKISKSFYTGLIAFLTVSSYHLYTTLNIGYVIEGVVGNVLGLYFIAVCSLSLIKIFDENQLDLLPISITCLVCIVTSHTLTPAVYFWIVLGSIVSYSVFNLNKVLIFLKKCTSNPILLILTFLPLIVFFFYLPEYFIDKQATELIRIPSGNINAISPSLLGLIKERFLDPYPTALSTYIVALSSLVFYFFNKPKTNFFKYYLLSWVSVIFLYVCFPIFFPVHLPGYRVINYIFYPLIILVSITIKYVKPKFRAIAFSLIFLFALANNTDKFFENVKKIHKIQLSLEDNRIASKYVSRIISDNENILADSVPEFSYPNTLLIYANINTNSNKLYIKSPLTFKYKEGLLSPSTVKMLEDPSSNIDLFLEKGINYLYLPNIDFYNFHYAEKIKAKLLFANNTIQILKVNFNE